VEVGRHSGVGGPDAATQSSDTNLIPTRGEQDSERACSPLCFHGRSIHRPLSHVKASLTAATAMRSLWAAERSSWVVGVLVGWVVDRLAACWPVSWEVVVAVDMKWFPMWFVRGAGAEADDSLPPTLISVWRAGVGSRMAARSLWRARSRPRGSGAIRSFGEAVSQFPRNHSSLR
jgi:hypothetical protein